MAVAGKDAVRRDLQDLTAHGLAELLPERGEDWWRPTAEARTRWARFFELPVTVEPNDQRDGADEVAELEAAFNAEAVSYDPLDEDF